MRLGIAGVAAGFLLCTAVRVWAQDMSSDKQRIYRQLRFRGCPQGALDTCSRVDAREMKAYVDALIDAGVRESEIMYYAGKRFSPGAIIDAGVRAAVEKRLSGELGNNRPLAVVDPLTHNFGKVSKKQGKVSCFFAVRNAGNAPLVISGIKVSCKCASAYLTLDKKQGPAMGSHGPKPAGGVTLAPGQAAELEVIFDLADRAMTLGTVFRNVTIATNDPLYSEIVLPVQATVGK